MHFCEISESQSWKKSIKIKVFLILCSNNESAVHDVDRVSRDITTEQDGRGSTSLDIMVVEIQILRTYKLFDQ